MWSTRILASFGATSGSRVTPTFSQRLAPAAVWHGGSGAYFLTSPSSFPFAPSSSIPSFTSSSPSFRPFSSSASLPNRFNDDRRQKPFQSFTSKYQPEIDQVMRKIENFSRRELIAGVSNGQILLLLFILSIFFPVQNNFNLFTLFVFMVVNML